MGFAPTALKLIIDAHKKHDFKGPVVTLGNQDIWASHAQLREFFAQAGCPCQDTPVIPHTSTVLQSMVPEKGKDFVHAKTFFGMMGIHDYWDLDIFDFDRPRILHDMNLPLPAEFQDRFNLVIDGGTAEHIFDIRQVMENTVKLCREDGWVMHITGIANWVDHSFFTLSPCFFYDFYQANGFEDLSCVLWQIDGSDLFAEFPRYNYVYGEQAWNALDRTKNGLLFFMARKKKTLPKLVIPVQGYYKSWQEKSSTNKGGQEMQDALKYALQIADGYVSFMPGGPSYFKGKTVLELGPGREFGPALIMAGYGAKVILADKYLASWNPDFHPEFYRLLRAALPAKYPGIDTTPLDQVIKNNDHIADNLQCVKKGLEDLDDWPAGIIDISISNAVFEHLYDSARACKQLGRLSKPGGLGFHQVDFRDHRDFSKPLEYITMEDDEFAKMFAERHAECANRVRYSEFDQYFKDAGFEMIRIEKNMFADEAYLTDVIARAKPRYKAMNREFLHVLSGRFYTRKK